MATGGINWCITLRTLVFIKTVKHEYQFSFLLKILVLSMGLNLPLTNKVGPFFARDCLLEMTALEKLRYNLSCCFQ